jgi:hypothetical protein
MMMMTPSTELNEQEEPPPSQASQQKYEPILTSVPLAVPAPNFDMTSGVANMITVLIHHQNLSSIQVLMSSGLRV